MTDVFVAVGSNIWPEKNILKATRELKTQMKILACSNFYRTAPLGNLDDPDFVNGMFQVDTGLSPRDLKFGVLRKIEGELGRIRSNDKNAPRPIDLDLILHGANREKQDDLVLPDPELLERDFLFGPLLDIAPDISLPDSTEKLRLRVAVEKARALKPDHPLTEKIKKEIYGAANLRPSEKHR